MSVEIGKRYLTGWGQINDIAGLTKPDPNYVWSIQGNWFHIKNGKRYPMELQDGTYMPYRKNSWEHLVVLPPGLEIKFFQGRMLHIRAVNPPDKLELVRDRLENMENRIKELQSQI